MKKIVLMIHLLGLVLLSSCSTEDKVSLIDGVNIDTEVFEEFIDPGVEMPSDYTLITEGQVNSNILGTYYLNYIVLDDEGVVYKEMTRIVNVVDTKPPKIFYSYQNYYIGMTQISDLISLYDNYTSIFDLTFSHDISEVNPYSYEGIYTITINSKDSSGNTSEESFEIEFIMPNMYDLLMYLSQSNASFVKNSYEYLNPGNELNYLRIYLNNSQNSLLVNEENLLQFDYRFVSQYGSAYISITSVYGNFTNSSVSIFIGEGLEYTRGSLDDFDATSKNFNNQLDITYGFINKINIPRTNLELVLNEHIQEAVLAFHEFFSNDLKIYFR